MNWPLSPMPNGPVPMHQPPTPKRLIDGLNQGPLKDTILHTAFCKQVSTDLIAMNFFGAVGTAINGKFIAERSNGHTERVQIYGLVIGEPAERKSSVVGWLKEPLVNWSIGRKRLHFSQLSGPALVEVLLVCGGRLACHEPEPGALRMFGRRDFPKAILNGGYDGEAITLDRAGGKSIQIEDPAIMMMINAQPHIAYEFGRQRYVADSGFLGRFLFINCEPQAGMRLVDTPPIPEQCELYYSQLITRLLEIPMGAGGMRHVLTLSPDAERTFLNFARWAEWALQPGRALSFDKAWGSKLPGKLLRLVGHLHCIEHKNPMHELIQDSTLRQGIEMIDVLITHARQFFFQIEHGETLEMAQLILHWARGLIGTRFSAQHANSAFPQHSRRMVNAGIDMLLRMGLAQEDLSVYQHGAPRRRGRKEGPFYRLADGAILP